LSEHHDPHRRDYQVEKMLVHSSQSPRLVRAIAVLAAAFSVTLSADSRGADPGKEAEEHYLRGKVLLKTGDVKGAYLEYKASWNLKQSYDIAANLGNLELEQGMPRDAAEHLAFALRTVAVTVPEDRIEAMRGLFNRARRLVGSATVKVNIAGAEILVDGQTVGRSPLAGEIFLDPGKRTIQARLSPYVPAQKVIDVARASVEPVDLVLVLPAATAPTSTAQLPPPPPPKSMIPVGVGVAAAAAALGVGIVGVVLSGTKAAEVDRLTGALNASEKEQNKAPHTICASNRPPECADLDSAFVAKGSYRNMAIAGFATAGVTALATAAWVLLIPGPHAAPTKETPSPVRASFGAGPSGGSVILSGQF
jgi:PEGA domain